MNKYSTTRYSLRDAWVEYERLSGTLQSLLFKIGSNGEKINYDEENLDEEFLFGQLSSITEELEYIERKLHYLSKPVTEQGYIRHNEFKRYALPSGTYFTTGDVCEILVDDRFEGNKQRWLYTVIKHNHEDYYAEVLGKETSIKGMMVRVREGEGN